MVCVLNGSLSGGISWGRSRSWGRSCRGRNAPSSSSWGGSGPSSSPSVRCPARSCRPLAPAFCKRYSACSRIAKPWRSPLWRSGCAERPPPRLPPERGQPEPPTERSRSASFPAPGCLAAFPFSCPRRAHCPLYHPRRDPTAAGDRKKTHLAEAHCEAEQRRAIPGLPSFAFFAPLRETLFFDPTPGFPSTLARPTMEIGRSSARAPFWEIRRGAHGHNR
jgi:hypothetical protein